MDKFYRCGFCGCPTDKNGNAFEGTITDEELELAELVHGNCCGEEQDEYVRITRDMAIDAGDRSLEGQLIKW